MYGFRVRSLLRCGVRQVGVVALFQQNPIDTDLLLTQIDFCICDVTRCQAGAAAVLPRLSRTARESTFITAPSISYGSRSRDSPIVPTAFATSPAFSQMILRSETVKPISASAESDSAWPCISAGRSKNPG